MFVRDRKAGRTEQMDVSYDGGQPDQETFTTGGISANGRYVAFSSPAGNLVPGDVFDTFDVFVRDRMRGTTERVSGVDFGGSNPSISANGRFVAFSGGNEDGFGVIVHDRLTKNTKLVGGFEATALSASGRYVVVWATDCDIVVHDAVTGTTTTASVGTDGTPAGSSCVGFPALSASGRDVAFGSEATNLVPGDTNGVADVFVREMNPK